MFFRFLEGLICVSGILHFWEEVNMSIRSDCIAVVILKNCEPELFSMRLFSMKSCFQDCWKVSFVV